MKTIKIGLLGLGTVGQGVYKVINNTDNWLMKVGANLEVKKILVRDISKKRDVNIPVDILTTEFDDIINDNEIDIIVEVMGGVDLPKEYIVKGLKSGKNIVTANKDLLAIHGEEILKITEESNKEIRFEASVAGGIPIIASLKYSLVGNNIQKVMGILNGTTNYIFTKMENEGYSYKEALKEAQELGFAEADPASDVEGIDAARKTAILASIAFNSRVTLKDVYIEGITKITATDFKYAKKMGYTIKLLGITLEKNGEIESRVHPTFIPLNHPMASVKNENNAVFVTGDIVGETMFVGKGAGELPTASAVVGDIASIAINISNSCKISQQCTCFYNKQVKLFSEIENKFYVRLRVDDNPGVLAQIASIFGENKVSIFEVIQKKSDTEFADLVIITDHVKEKAINISLGGISQLKCVDEVASVIRVEDCK